MALASQVLEGGSPAKYLNFLRSGGSRFPIETRFLQRLGAGMELSVPPFRPRLELSLNGEWTNWREESLA